MSTAKSLQNFNSSFNGGGGSSNYSSPMKSSMNPYANNAYSGSGGASAS